MRFIRTRDSAKYNTNQLRGINKRVTTDVEKLIQGKQESRNYRETRHQQQTQFESIEKEVEEGWNERGKRFTLECFRNSGVAVSLRGF